MPALDPERVMFGSDWSVCLLACEDRIWHKSVRQFVSELIKSEQNCLFDTSKRKIYSL
ncbi:MAG: putative TIM-barrel fold metal-dependent hydrolase [Pseudoalteromonas tetraodonis]|jgi:predicted TIM-barrel fold metal-dependent hydrolase